MDPFGGTKTVSNDFAALDRWRVVLFENASDLAGVRPLRGQWHRLDRQTRCPLGRRDSTPEGLAGALSVCSSSASSKSAMRVSCSSSVFSASRDAVSRSVANVTSASSAFFASLVSGAAPKSVSRHMPIRGDAARAAIVSRRARAESRARVADASSSCARVAPAPASSAASRPRRSWLLAAPCVSPRRARGVDAAATAGLERPLRAEATRRCRVRSTSSGRGELARQIQPQAKRLPGAVDEATKSEDTHPVELAPVVGASS